MPTRIDWLPYGISERNRALRTIATKIDDFSATLGLTAAEVDRIKAIAEEYSFAVTTYAHNRHAAKAMRAWRDAIISHKASKKDASDRPMFNNDPQPAGMKTGLIAEIRKYVRRIKGSPGYSESIGAGLGILTPNHVKKPLSELRPVPKVKALDGFRVKIACEMQGMDALLVEYKRNGEETFRTVAFLISLPHTFYIEPAVRGVPESGQIRCWFLKKNDRVGQPSSMPAVTIFGS